MRFLLILFSILTLQGQAQAATLVEPAGLNPGDPYHVIFVTSRTIDATSTDINVYNAFVQTVADAAFGAGHGATWKAVGSTGLVDALANISGGHANTGSPIYNQNGDLIANDLADLCDSAIANPVVYDENAGSSLPTPRVWTGTHEGCGDFYPLVLGELEVIIGIATSSAPNWLIGGSDLRGVERPLYALSSQLTIPVPLDQVSNPYIPVLATLGFGLLILMGRKYRRRQV